MLEFYGFIGFIFFVCLFKRKWKGAGILFIVILILTPFVGKSEIKESTLNYEQAITAIKNKDYNKAEELLNKVKDNDNVHYKLAQQELHKINDIKAEKNVIIAETKIKEGNYDQAKEELEKALTISREYKKANYLLEKVNKKIQDKIKADEEAQKRLEVKAQKEANKIISTDFISFEEPYENMTDLQKDDYFKKIKGRYVEWTGSVSNVDKHSISVRCLDSSFRENFIAIVDTNQKDKLSNIQKEARITIKGKISQKEGNIMPWVLDECVIVNK